MARHRGTYKPEHESPYELSRSKVEAYIKCPACFWLDRTKGVKFPSIPGFLLNSNTDKLLKKDFDQYRGVAPHPIMINNSLEHLIPFGHPDMTYWENSLSFGKNNDGSRRQVPATQSAGNRVMANGFYVLQDRRMGLVLLIDSPE